LQPLIQEHIVAEAYREVTEWKDSTKNGIYLLDGDKCLAFRSYKAETTYFKKPLQIDKRGRKFEKLTKSPFNVQVEKDPDVTQVTGSTGEIYSVNTREKTCSCSGFKFRGKCRHLEMV
jgi:hypothetical protein